MNHNILIQLSAACLILALANSSCSDHGTSASAPADTREIIVAVSPRLDTGFRQQLWTHLGRLVLEDSRPGDIITIFNGYTINQIVSIRIPNERVMVKNPRGRATRLAGQLKCLKEFLDRANPAASTGLTNVSDGAMLVPQLVELVATRPRETKHTSILLIGSPIYDNPKDLVWSFGANRYPSDSHLAADRSRTTFGCRGHEQWLQKATIYQLYPNPGVFAFEQHRFAVERFWQRYFIALGATPGLACGEPQVRIEAVRLSGEYQIGRRERIVCRMDGGGDSQAGQRQGKERGRQAGERDV